MATKTVRLRLLEYSGTSNLRLFLFAEGAASVLNGASGDVLTAESYGAFTCDVTEDITGIVDAVVYDAAGTSPLSGVGKLYIPSDTAGTYTVDSLDELNDTSDYDATLAMQTAIKAKTDLIGSVSATTASASETKSLTAAVGSTESVSVVCSETVDALTLAVSVQTKAGTVVATVADGSITKSGTTASFSLTSDMTASERILRVLITNTATSAQVASPILSVEYDT